MAKRPFMSRNGVPKQKRPFGRLERLVERYSGEVVLGSEMPAPSSKRSKAARTRPQERVSSGPAYVDASGPAKARLIGYARVSTDEQTTALQLDALQRAKCDEVFEDSSSGARRTRPGLQRALDELKRGDTLVVWRLDRLGRSLSHLLSIVDELRGRDVRLRSLTEHIDTATAAGNLLYAVLGAVAQFERDIIRERTVAGMKAAKKRGERIGRRPALTTAQVREARAMFDRGDGAAHIARLFRCGRSTLYRALGAQ